jgi:hypothetical protein
VLYSSLGLMKLKYTTSRNILFKNAKTPNFLKVHPVGALLFHADDQIHMQIASRVNITHVHIITKSRNVGNIVLVLMA